MIVNIHPLDTDYTENMPTGEGIEITSLGALVASVDGEIVVSEGHVSIISCEWGNGEGTDYYRVEVVSRESDNGGKIEQTHLVENKEDEGVTFVNLTPHTVDIHCTDGSVLSIPASGQLARVAQTTVDVGTIAGITVTQSQFGEITGLPEPKAGVAYIVSGMVLARTARKDVFAPGQAIRNANGQIVGCQGLSAASEPDSELEAARAAIRYLREAFNNTASMCGVFNYDKVDMALNPHFADSTYDELDDNQRRIVDAIRAAHGTDEQV